MHFYKQNSARGQSPSFQCEFLMWLYFILCMKVLLFNLLLSDSHLEYTIEMETSLSRTSLDLYNHIIFKSLGWRSFQPSSSYYWWGKWSIKSQSKNFAQSHVSDVWQCWEQNSCFSVLSSLNTAASLICVLFTLL